MPRASGALPLRALVALLVVASVALPATTTPSGAATAPVTASVTVASATNIDTTGCTGGAIDFGTVYPGSNQVTASACTVVFGSSNDTSMLKLSQADGSGTAMSHPTDGTMDATFGTAGVAVMVNAGNDVARGGIAIQSTGKLLQGGYTSGHDFYIARRLATDGSADATFGASGKAIVDMGATNDTLRWIAVMPDDSILAVGYSGTGATGEDSAILKLQPNGTPDPTFGTGGKVVMDLASTNDDTADGVLAAADGSIYVTGLYDSNGALLMKPYIARITASGALDTAWGSGGIFRDTAAPGNATNYSHSVLQGTPTNGRVIQVSGQDNATASAVAVDAATGKLDTTFGTAGHTNWDSFAGAEQMESAALTPDGKLLVSVNQGGGGNCKLFRTTNAGTADPTWGASGIVSVVPPGSSPGWCDGVLQDGNGSVYAMGDGSFGGSNKIFVMRLTPAGALDTTFAGTGLRSITYGTNEESGSGGILFADGKIVVGGMGTNGNDELTMGRLAGDASVPDYGTNTWGAGGSMFGVCLKNATNATANWTVAPGNVCNAADGAYWRAVPVNSLGATAKVAQTASGVTNGTAAFNYGFKIGSGQSAGWYRANLTFDVIAPAV